MNAESFASEAKPTVIEAAHDSFREFEESGLQLVDAIATNQKEYRDIYQAEAYFYGRRAELLIGLSIAKDLKRIADALERRHV